MIASPQAPARLVGPPRSSPSRAALLALDRVGFHGALTYLLQSTALLVPGCVASVWMHGENPAQFDAARSLIHEVMRDRPHIRLVLSSASPATVEYLRAAFPNDQVCPVPWNLNPVVRRFAARVNPKVMLLLDGGRSLGTNALAWALAARIPIRAVNLARAEGLSPHVLRAAAEGPADVQFCVQRHEVAEQLVASGVHPEALFVTGSLDLEPGRPALQSDPGSLRRLLSVGPRAAVVIAAEILPRDEGLLLDAFAQVKRARPDTCLVLEPAYQGRVSAILKQVRRKGWTGDRRSRRLDGASQAPWDVLLADVPGEVPALFRVASLAVIGGAGSDETDGANAAARAAGCPVVRVPLPASRQESETFAARLSGIVRSGQRTPQPATALDRQATRKTMDAIRLCLPASPPLPRFEDASKTPTLRDRAGRSGLWRRVAPALMQRRIDDWDGLRERMRHPQSVLCLGNGPSCEDPRVLQYAHDCLIRVNWRWKDRGFLTNPDLVFAGDAATVHKLPPLVFGIWNIRLEHPLLLRHAVTHGWKQMEYVTMERVSPIVRDHAWPARPSNGALMVVAGAALHPKRLIIGGMDLFLHPDGRYAGDVRSHNQYAHAHSRETDLRIIHLALEGFRGEVIILSDILRESLAECCSGAVRGL
jgi:3-deoxy-D-manno-octulosonic-acid transferase